MKSNGEGIMHFSVPEAKEVRDHESSYLIYNVYVNGIFHCSLRYRQFLALHEQIRREFASLKIPNFPPKKLLSLSSSQLEERRNSLESYIQATSQISQISASDLFNGFLRFAQHETSNVSLTKCTVDVYLPNGDQTTIELWNNAPTSELLKKTLDSLRVKDEFSNYFGLYIFKKELDGTWIMLINSKEIFFIVLRKLGEYECPYISIKCLHSNHRVVLRACYWDQSLQDMLIEDNEVLQLLYIQAVSDVENGWAQVPKEYLSDLNVFQTEDTKREYLHIARRLKFYGHIKFPYCQTSHLANELTVYIGNKELVFLTGRREEVVFKVTRMKCWRITVHHEDNGKVKCELSFEYLQTKDKLEWITISSEQAILMALCLQEMVADMLAKHDDCDNCSDSYPMMRSMLYFIRKDGSQVPINEDILLSRSVNSPGVASSISSNGSSVSSTPSRVSLNNGHGNGHSNCSPASTPTLSLSRKSSSEYLFNTNSTKTRPSNSTSLRIIRKFFDSSDDVSHENSAFAGIGDDDL